MTTAAGGLAAYLSTHPAFQDARSSSSPLPALYADLSRQRKSNPAGYHASIEWWKAMLLDVTFQGVQSDGDELPDRTVFRLDESTKARWTIEGVGRPLGLGTVIAELEKSSTAISLNTFLKSTAPIRGPTNQGSTWTSYIPSASGVASKLLVTPAKWAASQLFSLATGGGGDGGEDGEWGEDDRLFRAKKGDWVFYELIQRISSAFLVYHYTHDADLSPLSSLMTDAEFKCKLNTVCSDVFGFQPSDRDASLILLHLSRDRRDVLIHHGGIIKLAPSDHSPVEPITQEDRNVVLVRSTLNKVEQQILSLQTQIQQRTSQAKTSLSNKHKSQALSYLRSRQALNEVLTHRMGVRETMANVLLKIQQAKSDIEVMRAYKASANVLQSVLAHDELKLNNVHATVDRMQQALANQNEIQEALSTLALDEQLDDTELDAQLAALETEKKAEHHQQQQQQQQQQEQREQRERKEHEAVQAEQVATENADDQDQLQARFARLRVTPSTSPASPSATATATATATSEAKPEAEAEAQPLAAE